MGKRARRHTRRKLPMSRPLLTRILVVGPIVVALGWLSVAVSGSSSMRAVRPDLALKFQPLDARAHARAAELQIVRSQRRSNIDAAERFALAALQRDVTVAAAWRTLGVAALARNERNKAEQMFRFAGAVSHRDLPTQLWLIEDRVQRNDIVGALRHYDIALRTTRASHDILLPILVGATADDGIVRPLLSLLNTAPPWRYAFLERLGRDPPHAGNLVRIIERTRSSATADETSLWPLAMRTLVERRQVESALRIYRLLSHSRAPGALLRNGNFDASNAYPPFDWQLQDESGLGAEQRPSAGGSGNLRLYVRASSGSGGMVARQLLTL